MFHRRRASSNPPWQQNTNPTPSAAVAASQAFLKSPTSNGSLSSAAAATALRTQTTSPIPVGSVQTKRMQRKNSGSSTSSGPGRTYGPAEGALQRRGSQGSMTDRTFRSPSPKRDSPANMNAPPVPALPKVASAAQAKPHKRASSLDPTPAQTRVGSPPPRTPGGRGMSVDRGMEGSKWAKASQPTKTVNRQSLQQTGQQGSPRTSVNFSRPISPPPGTAGSPGTTKRSSHSGWFAGPVVNDQAPRNEITTRPKTSVDLPNAGYSVQQTVQNAADKPVAKKKKRKAPGVEGGHLASGSMNVKPSGTRIDTTTERPKSPVTTTLSTSTTESPSSATDSTASDSPGRDRPKSFNTRAAGLLTKQPSVVREHPELEAQEEQQATVANTGKKIGVASPPPENLPGRSASAAIAPAKTLAQDKRLRAVSLGEATASRSERQSSLSPARTPHFSDTPTYLAHGTKHDPPPRSVSPAKSALKHSPSSSIRTSSPIAAQATSRERRTSSEVSETGTDQSPKRKKKSVRVSFDEEPRTMSSGIQSSKFAPSSAKDRMDSLDDLDFEDIMKPTPALPSFGSVRGRKRNDPEQAPVEKEVTETVPPSTSTSGSTAHGYEHSNDHAVGGILARDFATNSANAIKEPTSSTMMDPLPPEVTSVEGSGYMSDSDTSIYSENPNGNKTVESMADSGYTSMQQSISGPERQTAQDMEAAQEIDVPTIAVQPATPAVDEHPEEPTYKAPPPERSPTPLLIMPGSFPESVENVDEYVDRNDKSTTVEQGTPSDIEPTLVMPAAPPMRSITPPATIIGRPASPEDDDTSSDDGSSIYSDAEEDMSYTGDGNFASLDAILESPVTKASKSSTVPVKTLEVKPIPPRREISDSSSEGEEEEDTPASAHDWEGTKAYWSGLSDNKRKELERQAQAKLKSEANEPDAPVIRKSAPKAKKAKAVPTVHEATRQPKLTPQPVQTQPSKPRMMRQSMRGQAAEPVHEETGGLRKTMRASRRETNAAPGLAASRYASPPPVPHDTKHIQKKIPKTPTIGNVPPNTVAALGTLQNQGVIKPSLKRTTSSDSESSFRRSRKATSANEQGRYTMRKSMRGAPVASTAPAPTMRQSSPPARRTSPSPSASPVDGKKRFSIRSLSPSSSLLNRTKATEQKSSPLRASVDSGVVPTLRGSPQPQVQPQPKKRSAISPPRIPGFGKKKGKSKAAAVPLAAAPRFRSRFTDSSDEEDNQPQQRRTFRSRFAADSDDEGDEAESIPRPQRIPSGLTPVRGIPRRQGEEDAESTDLEDEADVSDDGVEKRVGKAPPVPSAADVAKAHRRSEGSALATGSLRDKDKSGLGASKHAAPEQTSVVDNTVTTGDIPVQKQKSRRSLFGLGRKKDKEKEKEKEKATGPSSTSSENQVVAPVPVDTETPQGDRPTSPTSSTRPKSPKLQRRHPSLPTQPQRIMSDSWPLPPPHLADLAGENDRPATAEGKVESGAERPGAGSRRVTFDESGREVVVGRTGKKKRFGGLRKVFGLND